MIRTLEGTARQTYKEKKKANAANVAGQTVNPPSLAVTSTGTNFITLVVKRTDEP